MFITIIGSRETPELVCKEITVLAARLVAEGWTVRSGHADGADYAAETGAGNKSEIYLPWANFNATLPMLGKPIVVKSTPELDALVNKYHPAPTRLSKGGFALQRRNACQVMGLDVARPVWSSAVVCWTKNASGQGGTGQAIRIAEANGISVFDMARPAYGTAELVLKALRTKPLGLAQV